MTRPFPTDEKGFYQSPGPRDTTALKIYAVLFKPETNAMATTHWERGSVAGFAGDWHDLLATPAEIEALAGRGLRFEYPEQIEAFLDDGNVLETTRCFYRRDADAGNRMPPAPAGWTGPWNETL